MIYALRGRYFGFMKLRAPENPPASRNQNPVRLTGNAVKGVGKAVGP